MEKVIITDVRGLLMEVQGRIKTVAVVHHRVRQYNPAFSVPDLNAHSVDSRYVRETLKLLPQKPDPILIQEMGCRITKIGSINIGVSGISRCSPTRALSD